MTHLAPRRSGPRYGPLLPLFCLLWLLPAGCAEGPLPTPQGARPGELHLRLGWSGVALDSLHLRLQRRGDALVTEQTASAPRTRDELLALDLLLLPGTWTLQATALRADEPVAEANASFSVAAGQQLGLALALTPAAADEQAYVSVDGRICPAPALQSLSWLVVPGVDDRPARLEVSASVHPSTRPAQVVAHISWGQEQVALELDDPPDDGWTWTGELALAEPDEAHTVTVDLVGALDCVADDPPEPQPAAFVPGYSATCVVYDDGSPRCWGSNKYGEQELPPDLRVQQLSAGNGHICALRLDDAEAVCWGRNNGGQAEPPAGAFEQISAGADTCGLRPDGSLACWGNCANSFCRPPAGPFVEVQVAGGHACALRADGTVDCWGADQWGRNADPPGEFVQLSTGWYHSCALRDGGSVYCWGHNDAGECDVPEGALFSAVQAGTSFTCGLLLDGSVRCWGDQSLWDVRPMPGPAERFTDLLVAGSHACAERADGTTHCWGYDRYGETIPAGRAPFGWVTTSSGHVFAQRVDDTPEVWHVLNWSQVLPPAQALRAASVDCYYGLCCGLSQADGGAVCWAAREDVVVPNTPGGSFEQVRVTRNLACGLRADGSVQCWGDMNLGPAQPPEGLRLESLDLESFFGCGVQPGGEPICWGYPDERLDAPAGEVFAAVGVAAHDACGLRLDGTITCWGAVGGAMHEAPAGAWEQLSVGNRHACARSADQQVACWGQDALGSVQQVAAEGITHIVAGYGDTCGVRVDGAVQCWGNAAAVVY